MVADLRGIGRLDWCSGVVDVLVDGAAVGTDGTIFTGGDSGEVLATGPADGVVQSAGDRVDDGGDGEKNGSDHRQDGPGPDVNEGKGGEEPAEKDGEDA